MPVRRPTHRPEGRGPRAWVRRLLGVDVRWDIPAPQSSGDEASRRIRYRRVCARLRDRLPAPQRLLVVFPEGDEIARRAAGQLVVEAGSDPALRAVAVPVSRPMVPDRDHESGALVVVSAGAWTAAELAGIAEACADAKHEVVGVVLAGPVRAPRSADRPAAGRRAGARGLRRRTGRRDGGHRVTTSTPAEPSAAAPLLDLQALVAAVRRRRRLWSSLALLGLLARRGGGVPAAAAADRGDQDPRRARGGPAERPRAR